MKCLNYDGTGDSKEFVKKFQLQAAMFSWAKEKQCLILPKMVSGKAERVYEALTVDEKKEPDVILRAITAGCMQTKEVLLQKFYNSKPVSGELLSTFALKLQELLDKALPGLGNVEKNVVLRSQLTAYLPDYMKALIQYNQSQTWDDLLVALDSSHPYVSNVNEAAGCVVFKNEAIEANTINSSSSFNGVCHGCKKIGHKRYECPERNRSYNENERNSYTNRSNNYRSSNYNASSSRDNRGQNPGYNNGNRDNRGSNYDSNKYKNMSNNHRNNENRGDRNYNKEEQSHKGQRSANTMQIKEDYSSNEDDDDIGIDCNLIEATPASSTVLSKNISVEFNTLVAKVPLLKRPVRFTIGSDKQICKVRGLFDGGASNSFIRLASLPSQMQNKIKNFKNGKNIENHLKLEKENLTILSATGEATECCVIAKLHLEIGQWRGIHVFVITESLVEKDMILGRDFLKAYEVVIDHGTDQITIKKSLNLHKATDPVCYTIETKVLEPNTENVLNCHSDVVPEGRNVLFTPDLNTDGIYWANCLSTIDHNGDFKVKVLNLNDSKFEITEGMKIGAITECYEIIQDSQSIEIKTVCIENKTKERISRLKFGKKLTVEQRKRLIETIHNKMEAFQWEETDIGLTDIVEHEILTGDSKPIKLKQYKIPQAVQGVLDEQIKELVKNDLIEPSNSPWCSPMMIAKQVKKDGTIKYRFITDMTGLNSVTEKDSFPLPRMDQTLDQLGGAKFLSVIDMSRGYYQVGLSKKDRHKTAFSANNKL